jgi:protein-S-isoprenylcysteine O-methyltransferase Ste14
MLWLPEGVAKTGAIVLLAIGLPMWALAGVRVMRAYSSDRLVTTGLYSIVRHPMYSAWIVFNGPGIALWYRSWPVFLISVAAWAVFKAHVGTEDRYLEERYGQEYRDYRARVNEMIPVPWDYR